jgi:hypothetical protein
MKRNLAGSVLSNDIFYHIGLYQVHLTTDMIQMHQNLVMIGTNDKKGALDSQPQVIKFTMVGGSLPILRLPLPLKLVAMI